MRLSLIGSCYVDVTAPPLESAANDEHDHISTFKCHPLL
jgi:hypothetical protein